MIANPFFKEVINYVNSNTNLVVIDIKINPISISGHVGDNVFMYLSVQVGETGEYLCSGAIQYNINRNDWIDVFKIFNTGKTEKEMVDLIDKYINTARKLSKSVGQLETELGDSLWKS